MTERRPTGPAAERPPVGAAQPYPKAADPQGGDLAAMLARRRLLARAALLWERLWPALWPPLGVAGVFAVLALSGLFQILPGWLHLVILAGFAVALGLAAFAGFRGLRLPDIRDGDRRLERATGLSHRPLSILADRPAGGADPMADALWQAHQARAVAAAATLRVGAPRPGLAARDRYALRAAVGLAVVAAIVAAGGDWRGRLAGSVMPVLAAQPAAPLPVRLEMWVTPPAYTGLPPLFLRGEPGAGPEIPIPAGSKLVAHLSGGTGGVPVLAIDQVNTAFTALDQTSFTAERIVTAGARLTVTRDGATVGSWPLRVIADQAPTVAFLSPPAPAPRSPQLRISFEAHDDYGVASVVALLTLPARPELAAVAVPLASPGDGMRTVRGAGQPDLTAHPWAGLTVQMTLEARDGADQAGRSASMTVELPERTFTHPVAQALIALRKRMTLAPAERSAHGRELDRLSGTPEAFDNDTTVFLGLRTSRSRLARDRRPEAVDEVQEILWELAVRLEEGGRDRTLRQLNAAREEMREALERAERGEQVDPAELERLARQLEEAMQRYMEALAEAMRRDGAETLPFDRNARVLDQRDMQRMAREMQEAARRGDVDRMREQLAQLERALEALQQGRTARMESPERQQQREQGQQMMGAVNDMLQRQGSLMDRSHQRAQENQQRQNQQRQQQRQQQRGQPQQGQQGQQQQGQQQQGQPQAQPGQMDARQQQALRRALGELMQQFGDFSGEVPEPLGRADRAMRDAAEALRQGNEPGAQSAQQRAIEALQQGGREMQNQMAGRMGLMEGGDGEGEPGGENSEQGGEQSGEGRQLGEGRDPLGRPRRDAVGGRDEGSDVAVPTDMEQQRTREIQEELRRRAGERERSQQELDYIDRLLRRF
ncbi:TIGR02302 family protein [Elioraea sp.]|uniref:TIGR02302 family protein n=1 Tax=Elioraea sp. TaxID=2185103 RepID=UPI0025C33078|nr:TIGR02302 family protein [Elioraea sp.]